MDADGPTDLELWESLLYVLDSQVRVVGTLVLSPQVCDVLRERRLTNVVLRALLDTETERRPQGLVIIQQGKNKKQQDKNLDFNIRDETLKAVGPFYLVSMPGEVTNPTQGVNVKTVVDSTF